MRIARGVGGGVRLTMLGSLVSTLLWWSPPAGATVAAEVCSPRVAPLAPTLPANTPFRITFVKSGEPLTLRFIREDAQLGDVNVPFEITPVAESGLVFRVVPSSLVVGAKHRIEYHLACENRGTSEVYPFVVSPEAPLPSTLGSITASPKRRLEGVDGFLIDLPLTLNADVTPWAHLYRVTAVVDGVGKGGVGFVSAAAQEPVVIQVCNRWDPQGGEGRHAVQLLATPNEFDAPPMTSNTLVVDVRCEEPSAKAGNAGLSEGCTFSRGLRSTGVGAMAGTAAVVWLLARRRRSAQTR